MNYYISDVQEGGLFHPALGEYVMFDGKKAAIMPMKKPNKKTNNIDDYEYLADYKETDKNISVKNIDNLMFSPKYFLKYCFNLNSKEECLKYFINLVNKNNYDDIIYLCPYFIAVLLKKDNSEKDNDNLVKILQILLKKKLNKNELYNYSEIYNFIKNIDIIDPIMLFNEIIENLK